MEYKLVGKHNVLINRLLNKFSFRARLADEIFKIVIDNINYQGEDSGFRSIYNFDLQLAEVLRHSFIFKLDACNSDLSIISQRSFYWKVTQEFADILKNKRSFLTLIVPFDYISAEFDTLKEQIQYYYFLKRNQPSLPQQFSDKKTEINNFLLVQNNQTNKTEIHENKSFSITMKNSMTLEDARILTHTEFINKLRQIHFTFNPDQIKKEQARIIEFFLSKKLGFDFLQHSQRQTEIETYYEIPYNTYKDKYRSQFIGYGKSPIIEKYELSKAIVFVHTRILEKKFPEIFDLSLLETLILFYKNME